MANETVLRGGQKILGPGAGTIDQPVVFRDPNNGAIGILSDAFWKTDGTTVLTGAVTIQSPNQFIRFEGLDTFEVSPGSGLFRVTSSQITVTRPIALDGDTASDLLFAVGKSSDPINLTDGGMWFREDLGKFRVRVGGVTQNLATEEFVDGPYWKTGADTVLTTSVSISGGKVTFTPTSGFAGLNTGSFPGNPGGVGNADIWYNSVGNYLGAGIGGVSRVLAHFTTGTIGATRVPFVGTNANGDLLTDAAYTFSTGTGTLAVPRIQLTTTGGLPALYLGTGVTSDPTTTINFDIWSRSDLGAIRTKLSNVIYNIAVAGVGSTTSGNIAVFSGINGGIIGDADLVFNTTADNTLTIGAGSTNGNGILSLGGSLGFGRISTAGTFGISIAGDVGGAGEVLTSNGLGGATWAPGSSFVNSASNGHLIVSSGGNGVDSYLFNTSAGNLELGSSGLAGNRTISAENNTSTAQLTIRAQSTLTLTSTTETIVSGVKHQFTATSANAGLNVGSFNGDPSPVVNGDIWYNSGTNNITVVQNNIPIPFVLGTTVSSRVLFGSANNGVGSDTNFTFSSNILSVPALRITSLADNDALTQILVWDNVLGDVRHRSAHTLNIFTAPVVFPSYTVAGVPAAGTFTGGMIYITDETGGPVPAFSDGTNWRRVTDRAIIA